MARSIHVGAWVQRVRYTDGSDVQRTSYGDFRAPAPGVRAAVRHDLVETRRNSITTEDLLQHNRFGSVTPE